MTRYRVIHKKDGKIIGTLSEDTLKKIAPLIHDMCFLEKLGDSDETREELSKVT